MEYNRIVAVTGMPGLYEVVSSKSDGAIVRSLEDKSTRFVSSRIHNLSHLESIEVYTVRENARLADVFAAMKEGGVGLPDVKDNKALKSYFEKVYPDLDFERVYTSDMKKMIKWYETIQANDIDFTVKEEPTNETADGTESEAELEEEVVTEKATKTKAAKPKSSEAPAKKTASKKAAAKASADQAEAPTKGRKKKTQE